MSQLEESKVFVATCFVVSDAMLEPVFPDETLSYFALIASTILSTASVS